MLYDDKHEFPFTYLQCCSPRGKSLSSRILEDQFTSPCPCPWTTMSLRFKDFAFCKLAVMYGHVTSINSVTATEHVDTVKNVILTDVRYYLLIMWASKPFFTVTQCCCPRGKSLSLSSRTNFMSLSLSSIEEQFTSPYPCHRAISHWIQHWNDGDIRLDVSDW